jgi:ribose 1,5-bisphosphokinase PhnN
MMNVQAAHNVATPLDTYAVGHRDARHACAEIALQADAMVGGLCEVAKMVTDAHGLAYAGGFDDRDALMAALDLIANRARAALAAAEGGE